MTQKAHTTATSTDKTAHYSLTLDVVLHFSSAFCVCVLRTIFSCWTSYGLCNMHGWFEIVCELSCSAAVCRHQGQKWSTKKNKTKKKQTHNSLSVHAPICQHMAKNVTQNASDWDRERGKQNVLLVRRKKNHFHHRAFLLDNWTISTTKWFSRSVLRFLYMVMVSCVMVTE